MADTKRAAASEDEVYRQAWNGSHPWISYGRPFSELVSKHVNETFKASRVFIIASGTLSATTKHVTDLQDALGDRFAGVRHGMKPHTLWSEVLEVTEAARQARADLLVTLGAGSLTDAAKIVALALANDAETFEDLDQLHADSKTTREVKPPTVPIISIPTTLSGGEYSHRGGGTNDHDHRKYSFSHPTKGPALVILDPGLCISTPARWWISTGIRAVDHCTEGMCSLQSTTDSNADAAKGLKLLIPGLLKCKQDKDDVEAHLGCQMGVIEAMKAVNVYQIPMGASHGIGHQLGPLGVGHGETSCILLPAVCKYNERENAKQQKNVCDVLWSEPEVQKVVEDAGFSEGASLGDMLDAVFRFLGMPRTLSEFGITEDTWDRLAENSMHDRWIKTNPRLLREKADIVEILRLAR